MRLRRLNSWMAVTIASRFVLALVNRIASSSSLSGISTVVFMIPFYLSVYSKSMKTGILDRAVFAYLLRDAMRVASRCHARLMAGKPLGVVPSPAGPDDSPDVCFYVPGRACRRDPGLRNRNGKRRVSCLRACDNLSICFGSALGVRAPIAGEDCTVIQVLGQEDETMSYRILKDFRICGVRRCSVTNHREIIELEEF
jgi:hypothetical protein